MARNKLKIHYTEPSKLISHLRGEVGEIITSWIFLRDFKLQAQQLCADDFEKDSQNPNLKRLQFLSDKFADEVISRLSELSERKIGQINFFFARTKIGAFENEVKDFESFILNHGFRDKRNKHISHKSISPKWEDRRAPPFIAYGTLVRAIAMAVWLMKQIDNAHLGPRAKYLWHEMRKRRYDIFYPPHSAYMLLPYLRLSNRIRLQLIVEETSAGKNVWVDLPTKINGKPATVRACKDWGVVQIGNRLVVIDQYPLVELNDIAIS